MSKLFKGCLFVFMCFIVISTSSVVMADEIVLTDPVAIGVNSVVYASGSRIKFEAINTKIVEYSITVEYPGAFELIPLENGRNLNVLKWEEKKYSSKIFHEKLTYTFASLQEGAFIYFELLYSNEEEDCFYFEVKENGISSNIAAITQIYSKDNVDMYRAEQFYMEDLILILVDSKIKVIVPSAIIQ